MKSYLRGDRAAIFRERRRRTVSFLEERQSERRAAREEKTREERGKDTDRESSTVGG